MQRHIPALEAFIAIVLFKATILIIVLTYPIAQ